MRAAISVVLIALSLAGCAPTRTRDEGKIPRRESSPAGQRPDLSEDVTRGVQSRELWDVIRDRP
jgi:hypothetical protein